MKLFSLRLTTLKSKLYAIVFASFVVRVVVFFVLPRSPSNLAPDEGAYAELATWVSRNELANQHPYYGGLYKVSRALILPASLFVRIGLTGLDSVRLVASLYGLLTIVLAACSLLYLVHLRQEFSNFIMNNQKKTLFLLAILAFLPSNLTWSILGLRESATGLWVLVVFSLVFYVFGVKRSPSKLVFFGIMLTIPLVFSSRPQVGWVLGVTLLIYLLIKVKVKAAQILIPLTMIGILTGYAVTTALSVESTEVFVAHEQIIASIPTAIPPKTLPTTKKSTPEPSNNEQTTSSPSETSSPTATTQAESDASLLCKSEGQELRIGESKYICSKESEKKSVVGLKNPGKVILDEADAIPIRNELNKINAASVIETQTCPNAGNSRFDKYFCIVYRAPYTTFTFLFRPILGFDVTSSSSLFAAIENVFWLASALFVIIMFICNRRLAFFGALIPSLLFFAIYTIGAGAYEGNMGTAFRHKSLILWVVILLLASTIVTTQQRRAKSQGISGSSQE